jgi:hypothetical protein
MRGRDYVLKVSCIGGEGWRRGARSREAGWEVILEPLQCTEQRRLARWLDLSGSQEPTGAANSVAEHSGPALNQ